MRLKSFYVIVLTAIIVSVITVSVLRILDFDNTITVAGGIAGAIIGSIIGKNLKSD